MTKRSVRQLAFDAVLAALCAVLGYLAIDMGSIKFTFETLPVLMAGLLFGPLDGLAVGGVGTLVYQLLRYGVSPTTPLWMLPYLVCGLLVGGYAHLRRYRCKRGETVALVVVGELVVTALNTLAIYADSKLFGYYTPALITGALAVRLAFCVGKGIIFGALLPLLVEPLGKQFGRGGKNP